jgi:polar amino acid transport system substrate-binding protein
VKDGTLTVATSNPAFPPYVIKNDPTNGKGFESATAYAVADAMGFSADQVEWTFAPFGKLFAPGEKDFDFAINQIGIGPLRERAVTFSDPYYEAANGVLVLKDSPFADVTTLAELQDAKIGVQINTTAQAQVEATIAPTQGLAVYDDSVAATQALKVGQIDAFVTDLPTTLYISAVALPGKVVGQLPKDEAADTWGLVLQKDNPLVSCVNDALAKIVASGELEQITTEWMTDYTNAPVLG